MLAVCWQQEQAGALLRPPAAIDEGPLAAAGRYPAASAEQRHFAAATVEEGSLVAPAAVERPVAAAAVKRLRAVAPGVAVVSPWGLTVRGGDAPEAWAAGSAAGMDLAAMLQVAAEQAGDLAWLLAPW